MVLKWFKSIETNYYYKVLLSMDFIIIWTTPVRMGNCKIGGLTWAQVHMHNRAAGPSAKSWFPRGAGREKCKKIRETVTGTCAPPAAAAAGALGGDGLARRPKAAENRGARLHRRSAAKEGRAGGGGGIAPGLRG